MTSEPGFLPFKTRFGGMPYDSPVNDDSGALWYSYNVGGVHVVVISAYSDFSQDGPMVSFVRKDLAAVDRTVTPWIICVWVRAAVSGRGGRENAARQAYAPPLRSLSVIRGDGFLSPPPSHPRSRSTRRGELRSWSLGRAVV